MKVSIVCLECFRADMSGLNMQPTTIPSLAWLIQWQELMFTGLIVTELNMSLL